MESRLASRRKEEALTHSRLLEVVTCDPASGKFYWKHTRGRCIKGNEAGNLSLSHRRIRIDNIIYQAHRLVWFYVTGMWPIDQIDHINQNPTDNSFSNLREATHMQNKWNIRKLKNNLAGALGVSYDNRAKPLRKRFAVTICFDKKAIWLGRFETLAEAEAAYMAASVKNRGEFSPTNPNAS